MAKLYELTDSMETLLSMLETEEIDEQTLKDTLEAVEGEFEEKADGYSKVMLELDGTAETIAKEIERLEAKKKAVLNNKERLKKALKDAMQRVNKLKFKTDLFSYRIQKNPPSVEIKDNVDVFTLPFEYIKIKPPEVNKSAVKKAIEEGKVFDWAELKQTESLRIS